MPKGYESPAERDRRLKTIQAAERAAAEERRRRIAAKAQAFDEAVAIERSWDSLTPDQQQSLEADALAEADPETWENCRGKSVRVSIFRRTVREDRIRRLLKRP